MNSNRMKLYLAIAIFAMVVIFLGFGYTYAYFTSAVKSNENAVYAATATFRMGLTVETIYNNPNIIPMNDSDVLTGYANECVDVNGYGTCYAYSINLTNFGEKGTLLSEMNTTVTGIQNLKYIVLNSSDLSVYQPITSVVEGELQSLGPNFTLNTNETASYIIIFWISNLNQNQIGQDAGGTFDSDLTFRAVRSTEGGTISSKVTGTKK